MRPLRFLGAVIWALIALASAAPVAFAQSSVDAAAFAQGQKSTLSAPQTATAASTPGYGGNAANLQPYASDPTGLQSAGTNAMLSGNSMIGLTSTAADKATRSGVDINADWLKTAMGVSNDPMATAAGSTGAASTDCKEVTKSTSSTASSIYTCETSRQVADTAYQCPSTLVIDTQTLNTYACTSSYDQASKTWILSTQCLLLGSSGNCTKSGETCTAPGKPYYQDTTCNAGQQWSSTTKTCSQTRQVTVDTDYVYQCSEGTAACTTLSRQCSLTSSTCGAVTPPSYQTTSCQQGTTTSTSTTSCTSTRVVTVSGSAPKTYSCTDGYVGSSAPVTCGQTLNIGYQTQWIYGETAQRVGDDPSAGISGDDYPCPLTASTDSGKTVHYEWTCPTQQSGPGYLIAQSGAPDGGTWSYDGGACVGQSANCTMTNRVCSQGAGTRLYYGVNVYKDCWAYTETYSCSTQTQAAGCSPPAGYQLQSSTCSGTTNGACTQYDKVYADPNSGLQVSGEYWTGNCGSVGGNCTQTGTTTLEGAGTHNISGLNVYRDSWSVQNNYSCASTQAVNTCGNMSSCSESSRSCANAACTLYNITYSCQTSAGGCSRTDDTYRCDNQVSGAGSPTGTIKTVASDTWSNGCDSLKNDGTCKLASQTYSGGGTQTIDGLAVTRDSWSSSSSYTCSTSQSVDQCSGKTNGCSQQSKTCIGNDPQGNCSLYSYTYRCSADDGSGNCSTKTSGYSCTGAVQGAGTPVTSSTTQTGSHWELSADCPAASDKTCQVTATTCTQGSATRTVNGLSITADCWAKTTSYMCSTAGPQQSTCDPPKDCTFDHDECLDDPDPGPGKCITVQHDYQCKTTTTTSTTETQCSDKMCLGDSCFTLTKDQNNELPQTYAQLAAMDQAGKSYAGAPDLSIFKGQSLRCRKAILGFRNCCKDSGWGISLGLAQCDDQEKQLIDRQNNKATHYVGTYCSNKSFFGACLEKAMSYCGFDGSLARIIQEAGHTQLGKSWGSAKTPDCSGFTVDQFQQLDLSNVDFSDFYSEKMKSLTGPDSSSTVSRIQSSINNLYGAQSNPNPNGGL